MEQRRKHSKKGHASLAGIILRDGLVFVLCLVGAVIAIAGAGAPKKAAAMSQEPGAQVASLAAETGSPEESTTTPLITPEPELTPEPTAAPTATPEPASASGDFSAVFPAQDTGAGALLSYQTDSLRIAITKQEAYGATYFVADVWVKSIDAFRAAFAKDAYGRGLHEMPLDIANRANAVFAVSGDYYGARESGVVVRNGTLYRDVMGDDVCVLRTDGTLQIYRKGSFSALENIDKTVWQAWAFGPALVEDGKACDTSQSKIKVKNPRSAFGYYEPGHYCFIVVDGRQSGYSDGMTLDELAGTFASLGCTAAYNLDGGATAMMVFQGALVNHPTNGGRTSSDIIYF
jgi:exopolysaccharide biosynthesis protein